jgi:hypothetical protein
VHDHHRVGRGHRRPRGGEHVVADALAPGQQAGDRPVGVDVARRGVERERQAAERRDGLGQQRGRRGEVEVGDAGAQGRGVVVRPVAGGGEQHGDVGVAQQPDELGAGREGAERHAHRPGAGGGQPGHDEVGPVGVEDRDPGAGPGPRGQQPARQRGRDAVCLAVGEAVGVAHEQHVVGPLGGAGGEQGRHRHGQAVAGVDHRRGHGAGSSSSRAVAAGRSTLPESVRGSSSTIRISAGTS